MKRILIALSFLLTYTAVGQEISAPELLNRSISFHDPDSKWNEIKMDLVIHMEGPGRTMRPSKVVIDNKNGTFELRQITGGREMVWMVDNKDTCSFLVDYREPLSQAEADSLNLTNDRARRMRNYYSYLYGLPMKLRDEGTIIAPEVQQTTFNEKDVLALKVTYDEAVGSDVWYFYFNPDTYAMEGYRFYHDESINDGEYITLEGMSIENGIRIPRDRAWYVNKDDRLLAIDYLKKMEIKK